MAYYFKVLKFIILLILIGVGIVFAASNQAPVPLDLYPVSNEIRVPLYAVILLSFFIGSVCTSLFFGLDYLKKSIMVKNLNKEVSNLRLQQTPKTEITDPKV